MIHGVFLGVRSCVMFFLENCFAKTSISASDCSVVSHLKVSGFVLRSIGMFPGVELPSGGMELAS